MKINAIKTRKFLPPKDDLRDLLSVIKDLEENSIVAVTSKVVAISEGRCIPENKVWDKDQLVRNEADQYLERSYTPGGHVMHTIKDNLLISTAGIDQSNGAGYYILWPKDPKRLAQKIWQYLKGKFRVKNLGVIITDSHSIPLRRGLVGISLGHFGFMPLHDYRGEMDLFKKELQVSQSNIPDSLASAAVLSMGEGNEQTPIALITDLPKSVKFIQKAYKPKTVYSSLEVPMDEDLYSPFLKSVPWKKGKGGKV